MKQFTALALLKITDPQIKTEHIQRTYIERLRGKSLRRQH